MRLPPPPVMLKKQRFDRRFWRTDAMLEVLSVHYGALPEQFSRTWQYRTIIMVHRQQHTHHAYRKRYGSDWKPEIKPDVVEYTRRGRLPLDSLRLAADALRAVEREVWIKTRAAHIAHKRLKSMQPTLAAAE